MAALTTEQREEVWREFMAELSELREEFALPKADSLAAVNAYDTWIDGNAVSANQALPVAFRTAATVSQKARLANLVNAKRFITGA